MAATSLELKKHFRKLRDSRRRHRRLHRLLDLVVIAIAAVTGGADTWREIAPFGRRHETWFKRFLALENGIPSHDTFERVFAQLDPPVLQAHENDFIGSQKGSARYYALALRQHWGIENNLHWQMDVSFAEDANRTVQRPVAENPELVRRAARTLVKRHPQKEAIKCKRRQAGWDLGFLEEILRG